MDDLHCWDTLLGALIQDQLRSAGCSVQLTTIFHSCTLIYPYSELLKVKWMKNVCIYIFRNIFCKIQSNNNCYKYNYKTSHRILRKVQVLQCYISITIVPLKILRKVQVLQCYISITIVPLKILRKVQVLQCYISITIVPLKILRKVQVLQCYISITIIPLKILRKVQVLQCYISITIVLLKILRKVQVLQCYISITKVPLKINGICKWCALR